MIFSLSPLVKSTARFELKRFADGEIYVRVLEKVKDRQVWVVGGTEPPADKLLELLFLLDALKRSGARINLFLTYFGYARQDRVSKGECFAGKLVCDFIRKFDPMTFVLDMHSRRLKAFLDFKNIVPYDLMVPVVKRFDVVVAPDKGRADVARELAKYCSIDFALIEKFRPEQEKVKVLRFLDDVRGKRCIIADDMISTGGTILEAAKRLYGEGAREVSVIATHGVFSAGAVKRLQASRIKRIYVTNSLPQKKARKLVILDVSCVLKRLIRKR